MQKSAFKNTNKKCICYYVAENEPLVYLIEKHGNPKCNKNMYLSHKWPGGQDGKLVDCVWSTQYLPNLAFFTT